MKKLGFSSYTKKIASKPASNSNAISNYFSNAEARPFVLTCFCCSGVEHLLTACKRREVSHCGWPKQLMRNGRLWDGLSDGYWTVPIQKTVRCSRRRSYCAAQREPPDRASPVTVSLVETQSLLPPIRPSFMQTILLNEFTLPALLVAGAETSVTTYDTSHQIRLKIAPSPKHFPTTVLTGFTGTSQFQARDSTTITDDAWVLNIYSVFPTDELNQNFSLRIGMNFLFDKLGFFSTASVHHKGPSNTTEMGIQVFIYLNQKMLSVIPPPNGSSS